MNNLQTIPEGSVEVQVGLWAYLSSFTAGGVTYAYYDLYSAEGYCFYDLTDFQNYDEDGNLKPENERLYAQYCTTLYTTIDEINANIVSVPVQDGYEIVSAGSNHETA